MKLLLALMCLTVALCALTGCGTDIENTIKAQANLTEAQRNAQIGQLAQARVWSDRAIAVNPHSIDTYVVVPTTDDTDAPGIISLGTADNGVFSSIGDLPDTIAYMKKAQAALPQNILPLEVLDQVYGEMGDLTDQHTVAATLAALLEKQIARPGATRDETLMLALSEAYFDAGNPTQGTADGLAVIHAFPAQPNPYNQLAYDWALADSKPNLLQAHSDAQKALALSARDGSDPEQIGNIQDTLAWVLYRQGAFQNALPNSQSAVSADPRQPEERYHLGMIYAALKEPDAARAELTQAVNLMPGYAAAQTALAALPASTTAVAALTRPGKPVHPLPKTGEGKTSF
jgi:tetratricopeptide (TPR) repeat protein